MKVSEMPAEQRHAVFEASWSPACGARDFEPSEARAEPVEAGR